MDTTLKSTIVSEIVKCSKNNKDFYSNLNTFKTLHKNIQYDKRRKQLLDKLSAKQNKN